MATSRQLLLIRHAATDMAGTFCGQSDPPLNAVGRAQAESLAFLMRTWQVRRLYSSDLKRAEQTASILGAAWNVPVETKSSFREVSFGDWEGKRWSDVRDQGLDITTMESSPDISAPSGESFGCFRDRVLRGFDELDCSGQTTAIVTHLGVIRILLKKVTRERMTYCCVYPVRLNEDANA